MLEEKALALPTSRFRIEYFWADWCSVCKATKPALMEWAGALPDTRLISRDCGEPSNAEVANVFGIASLPTYLIFKGNDLLPVAQANSLDQLKKEYAKLHD